jgi:hypothetical protein
VEVRPTDARRRDVDQDVVRMLELRLLYLFDGDLFRSLVYDCSHRHWSDTSFVIRPNDYYIYWPTFLSTVRSSEKEVVGTTNVGSAVGRNHSTFGTEAGTVPMDVLGDLVARDRRSSRPAFTDAGTDRSISYRDFCTTAYKAGNVLRYLGVREDATVGVVGPIGPQPLWAFYGAAQLGAVTWFTGDSAVDEDLLESGPRVLLVPVVDEASVDPGPSTKLAAYGGAPAHPTTLHWEQELWSENPAVHPTDVAPSEPLLAAGEGTYTHGEALDAARAVVERVGLDAGTTVVVRGSLSDPRVVVAGLVAPTLAGGTVVVPADGSVAGDVAVVDAGNAPEDRVCRADDVLL